MNKAAFVQAKLIRKCRFFLIFTKRLIHGFKLLLDKTNISETNLWIFVSKILSLSLINDECQLIYNLFGLFRLLLTEEMKIKIRFCYLCLNKVIRFIERRRRSSDWSDPLLPSLQGLFSRLLIGNFS